MGYKTLDKCLACGGTHLDYVLNLGRQPLANNFLDNKCPPNTYPLDVLTCKDCTHCQLSAAVDPEELYRNYLYVSGTTETLREHFRNLVNYTLVKAHPDSPVLDIACNDGSLMEEFTKFYASVEGIDPAENLRKITKDKNLKVHVDYWNSDTPFKLGKEYGIITVLNCLAHNPNPYDFLKGCYRALSQFGMLIIEFPLFSSTLDLTDIGQIYHEHHSYFTAKSLVTLLERVGAWYVEDFMFFPDIHGGTGRFVIRKGLKPHCQKFSNLFCSEVGIVGQIEDWSETVFHLIKENLRDILWKLKEDGKNLVAYSASAKSTVLFNYIGAGEGCIKWVVDDNPLKQGLFCPGSNLKIKSIDSLIGMDNLVILLTAHNFKKEIIQRLKDKGIKFELLNYVPSVYIEDFT